MVEKEHPLQLQPNTLQIRINIKQTRVDHHLSKKTDYQQSQATEIDVEKNP